MTRSEILVRASGPADDDDVADLACEYLTWAADRLRSEYGVEWPPIVREDVQGDLDAYQSSGGTVLVAAAAGRILGIGAVRLLGEGVAEIKRMFVREDARGLRVGSALLDELLSETRALGASVVRLDTIRFMVDAQRLYRSRGFEPTVPYEGSEIPAELQEHWLFFECALVGLEDRRAQ